ncbi:MAG: hypothetical protein RLZ98_1229 [Pseudomonadota bacterium]|jgi:phosphohistidine phosphatase
MLTLSLLRHAKSSWDDTDLDDHERPLAKRGTKTAPLVGKFIANELPPINRVLCSDAVRTRATLTLVLAELGEPLPDISYEPDLYLATPATYLRHLARCADADSHVMMVGHNPGMQMLALELTKVGEKKDLAALAQKFPTAALAVIQFDARAWREACRASGQLVRFVTPKELG